jgi:hypothetical protein
VDVQLQIIGSAVWQATDDTKGTGTAMNPGAKQDSFEKVKVFAADENGVVTANLIVTGAGPIIVTVEGAVGIDGFYDLADPSGTVINSGLVLAPVSKLKLVPSKAYRHVGDPITITALALDANNGPVPNAEVAFSVSGNCEPTTDTLLKTTSATGIATVTVTARRPGVVTVVASGVGASGSPLVAQEAAHVEFFEERHSRERHYEEHMERDYYHGPGRDRYVA